MWYDEKISDTDESTFKRVLQNSFGSESSIDSPQSPADAYWENQFCSVTVTGKIHGSSDECFENSAYKVRQLFIDTPKTQETEMKLLTLVEKALVNPEIVQYKLNGLNMLVAHLLSRYPDNEPCLEFGKRRIHAIANAITDFGYDIYLDEGEAAGVPAAFKDRKIVNPDLIPSQIISLPQVHDILYFHIIGAQNPDWGKKIDSILRYILSDEYQAFPEGYGVGLYGKRYYSIGWSITLPSFTNNEITPSTIFNLIHLSNYSAVVRSSWYANMMNKLDLCQAEVGWYEFPKNVIREKKNTYFVGGGHLGVIENRRLKNRNKIESTYWYNVIKQNEKNC